MKKEVKKEGGWFNKNKKKANPEDVTPTVINSKDDLIAASEADLIPVNAEPVIKLDIEEDIFEPVSDIAWYSNLESPNIPVEVLVVLNGYKSKLDTIPKKYPDNTSEGFSLEKDNIIKYLIDLYMQGKLQAYSWTDFLPVYK